MDPNKTENSTTPTQPMSSPGMSANQSTTVSPPTQQADSVSAPTMDPGHIETKSNTLMYVVIGTLLLILLALTGLFFYRQFSSATDSANETKIVVPTQAPVTPTIVIPTYSSPEEKDAMGVDIGDVDSQLKIIQDDVKKL